MPADILIVDDNPNNLKLLIAILTDKGYKVRPATTGLRALSTVRKELPDLILLDVMMPDMDGYEVCRQLKSDPATADIPIIFISALDEVFDKVRAFQAGAVDYVTKPLQEAEVLARIESQLTIQEQKRLLQQEIEQRQMTEAILFQSRALLTTIMNTAHDGIMAYESVRDWEGRIEDFKWIMVNSAASRMVKHSADHLIGRQLLEMFPFVRDIGLFDEYVEVVETGRVLDKEIYIEGSAAWIHILAVKLGDGLAATFRNTTERKQMEQELQRLANLDGLTQIANRRAFDDSLEREWKRCARNQQPLALILCDVDHFKRYNDTYGHILGDACLTQVAGALQRAVKRPGDLVARYGGEEFAVILSDTDTTGAVKVAEEMAGEVRALGIPHLATQAGFVTLSFGVACAVPNGERSPNSLLSSADEALYQAKEQGRNQVAV